MDKFRIGDRVKCIDKDDETFGMEGTVFAVGKDGDYDVVFDGYAGGHGGEAGDLSRNHWYVEEKDIEAVVPEQKKRGRPVGWRKQKPMRFAVVWGEGSIRLFPDLEGARKDIMALVDEKGCGRDCVRLFELKKECKVAVRTQVSIR